MFAMLKMLPIFLVIGLLGVGYHTAKVKTLEAEIAQLRANNQILVQNQEQLKAAELSLQESIATLNESLENERAQIAQLTARNDELVRDKETYLRIFKDHNLTRLARAKPGLIENRINNGTSEVFRQVEEDSKLQ